MADADDSSALETLELDELRMTYPGEQTFPLAERIMAVPLVRPVNPDHRPPD